MCALGPLATRSHAVLRCFCLLHSVAGRCRTTPRVVFSFRRRDFGLRRPLADGKTRGPMQPPDLVSPDQRAGASSSAACAGTPAVLRRKVVAFLDDVDSDSEADFLKESDESAVTTGTESSSASKTPAAAAAAGKKKEGAGAGAGAGVVKNVVEGGSEEDLDLQAAQAAAEAAAQYAANLEAQIKSGHKVPRKLGGARVAFDFLHPQHLKQIEDCPDLRTFHHAHLVTAPNGERRIELGASSWDWAEHNLITSIEIDAVYVPVPADFDLAGDIPLCWRSNDQQPLSAMALKARGKTCWLPSAALMYTTMVRKQRTHRRDERAVPSPCFCGSPP